MVKLFSLGVLCSMIKGFILLLIAAFSFAFSTTLIKVATAPPHNAPVSMAIAFQFFISFAAVAGYALISGRCLKPKNPGLVFWRSFFYLLSVILIFTGVKYTTVTNANILNLTYPVFVFLLAPFINHEKTQAGDYFFLATTLAGVTFIVTGDRGMQLGKINYGDILSLLSALASGTAISLLREARKHDQSPAILFYQMAFGSLVAVVLMLFYFRMLSAAAWGYLAAIGLVNLLGQISLTTGYRYIRAAAGSVVLGSGIFFGAFFGITFFGDRLSAAVIIGALLIFFSLVGVSGVWRRPRPA
jgi:drug/metabolite transporter (DMT)-like permease